MLQNVVYAVLAVITWSAFAYKAKDLVNDRGNRELRLLCLAIATFAAPFVTASPWLYVRIDRLLGYPNIATLITYVEVAVCLASFIALLVSWSSAQTKVRLRQRVIVAYSVATILAMIVLFLLGDVGAAERPIDFDVYYAQTPYITQFLLLYFVLFSISMSGLIRLCWKYAKAVDAPWLRRGLRTVTVGAWFGLGYSTLKTASLIWGQFGDSPLAVASNDIAPMSASVAAAAFSVGFTMPAWGAGVSRSRQLYSDYRAYQRLYPLWRDLTCAFPDIVLLPSTPRQARWSLRSLPRLLRRPVIEVRDGRLALRPHTDPEVEHTTRDLGLLRHRQVVEIRDGQLALRRHYDSGVAAATRALGADRGLTGDSLEALVEAAQIAAALRARAGGTGPRTPQLPLPHDPAADDVAREADWLAAVAEAYSTSPVVAAFRSGTPVVRPGTSALT
ncbi:MAB_1171c family putative transporter [Streptomyces sp. NPDC091027]|uniref:MAB_1171c family putative transporter n=1 Tax=Streptomyces sp. NPDC091027 TaxID=3365971 RepID=UPI0037F960AD